MNLENLRNKFKNERCFIMGNGPSINHHDLTKLSNEKTFATNMFVLHPLLEEINLKFFCASDTSHWKNDNMFLETWVNAFPKMKNCYYFFYKTCKDILKEKNDFDKVGLDIDKVAFLNVDLEKKVFESHFSIDPTQYTCWGKSVIIDFCLPLAYFMGFSTIYLLGCDCNYNKENKEDLSKSYFYDYKDDKRKLKKKLTGTEEHINSMINSYKVVKQVFESDNRKIYNAGFGGMLEVFPRVNYDDLF